MTVLVHENIITELTSNDGRTGVLQDT